MGAGTVIASFVMCILFNVLFPNGDVYSDVYLMVNTLKFDLRNSLELKGCKVCYGKSEAEIYSKKGFCNICLTDEHYFCGSYPLMLDNIEKMQNKNECANEPLRFTMKGEFKTGVCQKTDACCFQSSNKQKFNESVPYLDPRITMQCIKIPEFNFTRLFGLPEVDFDYCFLAGMASSNYCWNLHKLDPTVPQQVNKILFTDVSLGGKYKLKNKSFTYERFNETSVEFSSNFSYERKCGLYLQPRVKDTPLNRKRCNDDACLIHLQHLHQHSNLYDLKKWSNATEYVNGQKVGGKTCQLLYIYAISILLPILLNLVFTINIYKDDLENGRAQNFEVIPLLLLCYPQYKTLKFLANYAFHHRDETRLDRDKEEYDRTVAPLEPFLESAIQVSHFFD